MKTVEPGPPRGPNGCGLLSLLGLTSLALPGGKHEKSGCGVASFAGLLLIPVALGLAKVPKPRKPGQTGGRGGHGRNMHSAQKRDSRPMDSSGCGKK